MSAKNATALRKTVSQFFAEESGVSRRHVKKVRRNITRSNAEQMQFDLCVGCESYASQEIVTPNDNLIEFFDFIAATVPEGDVYLFGGMLRDLAMFGRSGFNSDIDVVVDGDWGLAYEKLIKMGAVRNKFGGLRFYVKSMPIDLWLAKETWAIREGYVEYKNIMSLLDTTVLNWDAILMSWRNKTFFHRGGYFSDINEKYMDIVLECNPNPIGMLVRILRHILMKDANRISYAVSNYLTKAVNCYTYDAVVEAELKSYGTNYIHKKIYDAFKKQSLLVMPCDSEKKGIWIENIKNPTGCLSV